MKDRSHFIGILAVFVLLDLSCFAVTSKVSRYGGSGEPLKGKAKDVIIDSKGTMQLGRGAEIPVEELKDVWTINSVVVSAGTVFAGTSPNGIIYKYHLGKLTRIYPQDSKKQESNDSNDPNTVKAETYLSNEHIFAMASDISGRLLAGISGAKCRLVRFNSSDKMEVIFEPNDAKYIFAITIGSGGNIYLGTGPAGKIYQLDSFGKNPQLVYAAADKSILSLAVGKDGSVYAGSDVRGLVYKIDPRTRAASVLYDSDQEEVVSLLFAGNDLFAAATSAKIVPVQGAFSQIPVSTSPQSQQEDEIEGDSAGDSEGLEIRAANTTKDKENKQENKPPLPGPVKPGQNSFIYKISSEGFVTDVFSENVIFFTMALQGKKLLVGTGNDAKLFAVEPDTEKNAVIYNNERSSQITAVAVSGTDIYLGMSNPPRLVKLGNNFAAEGKYVSEFIDAGQPANWGKLQIEADVPAGCKVLVSSRSGNVKDVNDPTLSGWTTPAEVKEPMQLNCPMGRYCQYELTLRSEDGQKTPVIREITVADTIPNLAPKIESVSVTRSEEAGKTGIFKITCKDKDENGDQLVRRIDFRKNGRTEWIKIKDQIEADNFEWDSKTVEDGRYEIRVTASDERSNNTTGKLTANRIDDHVTVDNTAPVIKEYTISTEGKTAVTLKLRAVDQLSAIGQLSYTVDSNEQWKAAVPDDLVYDTTEESFTIVIDELKAGEHVIAIKLSDALGNTSYKTYDISL